MPGHSPKSDPASVPRGVFGVLGRHRDGGSCRGADGWFQAGMLRFFLRAEAEGRLLILDLGSEESAELRRKEG